MIKAKTHVSIAIRITVAKVKECALPRCADIGPGFNNKEDLQGENALECR